MNEVLTAEGLQRTAGKAHSKETLFYDFNRNNAAFLLDIVHAFGMTSQQDNENKCKTPGKILGMAV